MNNRSKVVKNRKASRRKKRRRMMIRRIVLLAIVLILGIGLWVWWKNQQPAPPKLSIDPNAGQLATPTPEPEPVTPEPDVSIAGWSKITVPAHSLKAATSLYNPKENEGYYYLTYQLLLKETNEVIFETGLIPPGLSCNEVTLTRELESGSYPAILHVQPYRMNEELSATNNANLELMLIVE